MIKVEWSVVDGNAAVDGTLLVIWTARDRRSGKRPNLFWGRSAAIIASAFPGDISLAHPTLLAPGSRVRRARERTRSRWFWRKQQMEVGSQRPRLVGLSVRGFRGFRETAELRLAMPNGTPGSGLTIIVGANNVGKSTLWESFDAIARRLNAERWPTSDVSFSEGKRNRRAPNGVRIAATFTGGAECAIESMGPDTSETRSGWETDGSEPPTPPTFVVVPSRRQFQARFGRGGQSSPTWMTASGEFSRYQMRDGFSSRLFDLHADEAKKRSFDKLLTEVLGTRLEWSIDLADGDHGGSYYLKVAAGADTYYSSEGLGEGIISLLFILNALYDATPETVVVIDEPELSLHPQAVRRLGVVLARFASDRQITIFTHSPALVSWDAIANGAEVARVYKRGHDSAIAQADRAVLAEISKLRGSWNNPHVIGLDAKETLFLEDGLIVLEGQDDAALLPRVAELVGVELGGSVYGWGAGGEGNIEKVLALLKSLDFARVAAVFDNNVPEKVERVRRAFPGYLVTTIPAADVRTKRAESAREEKAGLLDKNARRLRDPELAEPTRVVLDEVNAYLNSPNE
ncbi:ATP-dependent nuclease [Microbacterium sp. RD1]|uniref:ATP-dependent nuclease n=1 Tax=Microbacterium sp. RD1 TaxID=3457313 RepID=UPI003FA54117